MLSLPLLVVLLYCQQGARFDLLETIKDKLKSIVSEKSLILKLFMIIPCFRRKATSAVRPVLDSSALSSDDDSFYDPSSITSILTESNLQTSSC